MQTQQATAKTVGWPEHQLHSPALDDGSDDIMRRYFITQTPPYDEGTPKRVQFHPIYKKVCEQNKNPA